MDHHYGSGASGTVPGFTDRRTTGRRPNGIYIARFRNVKTQHPNFLRGYGMQGGSSRSGWGRGSGMPGYGASFKQSLIDELGPWRTSTGIQLRNCGCWVREGTLAGEDRRSPYRPGFCVRVQDDRDPALVNLLD